MVRAGLLLYALFGFISFASAQCPGMTTQQTPYARERLPVGATAVPLTVSVYKPSGITPSMATVYVEGGTIRWDVIITPTASDGNTVLGGGSFPICGFDSIAAFKAIRITSDALLTITYYKAK